MIDIEKGRALAAKATGGPWYTTSEWSVRSSAVDADELITTTSYDNHENDAEFIAHVRDAYPAALDEIEKLRHDELNASDEFDRLRAVIENLRAQLASDGVSR